jgi:hypothetical protein
MEEDRPAEDDAADAEPDAATPNETEEEEAEETEQEAAEPEATETEPEATETAERPTSAPGGISPTTTTGDPDKDVGGPSVAEESRRKMDGDQALEEPGYGDLGHAEDFDVLRDD